MLSLSFGWSFRRAVNDNLLQMATMLYDYWFTQFDYPNTEGKPYRASGGRMVWNTELKRMIPEGWTATNLGELAQIVTTSVTPNPADQYHHFSIPAFDNTRMPDYESGSNIDSNKYIVKNDYILVSKLNPRFKRIWVVSNAPKNSICSTEFMPFVSRRDDNEYLYGILNSDAFYTYMVNSSSSSTGSRKRMSPELCLMFKIARPPCGDIIQMYCNMVRPLLNQFNNLVTENYKLVELRDFLLPALMNGQATVRD